MQRGPSCPEGHLLAVADKSDMDREKCDMCGVDKKRTGGMEVGWSCSENWSRRRGGKCSYDVCTECVHRYKVRVSGGFIVAKLLTFIYTCFISVFVRKRKRRWLCVP